MKFGKYTQYWEVFDPYEQGKVEAINGCLADDIADIYCDVKEGLLAWEKADAKKRRSIVYTWSLNYGHGGTCCQCF